jgi:solute carrier family 25 folate transporter 32
MSEAEINFFAGIAAGLSNVLVCAPLDTARTRLQTQGLYQIKYKGIFQTLSKIYKEEGIKGLYMGSSISMIAYPINWSFYFFFYESLKFHFQEKVPSKSSNNFISASAAGVLSTILTNPLWLIRVRMQVQEAERLSGLKIMKDLIKNEGFFSLYRGLSTSIFGVIHVAIYFPLYEYMKDLLLMDQVPTFTGILLSSWIPKIIASGFSYPYEVLRARLYIHNHDIDKRFKGLLGLVRFTFLSEGFKGFYGGFFANLLRILPANFVTLYTYEEVKFRVRRRRKGEI